MLWFVLEWWLLSLCFVYVITLFVRVGLILLFIYSVAFVWFGVVGLGWFGLLLFLLCFV